MAKTLVYHMYPFAWKAGLKDMTKHLYRINQLDLDYIWVGPLYPSPGFDQGYDVADYMAIDPRFGTMEEFDLFVKTANSFGVGIIIDLVLNHTSVEHRWFKERPEYYCWSSTDTGGWHNLFNNGSAWEYDEAREYYYLHLFHPKQADLRWFCSGGTTLNQDLVKEFRKIVDFWVDKHGVSGFRLDMPQAINKDFKKDSLTFYDLLCGDKAIEVLNAVLPRDKRQDIFLIMECFDPYDGFIMSKYYQKTAVDFILSVGLKDRVLEGDELFNRSFRSAVGTDGFMLDFESHDAPRFPSRGIEPESAIWRMFNSGAEGICLYQGQELGLNNPSKIELSDELMLSLDAQTKMRFEVGEKLDSLRPKSRANARVPIPIEEYVRQEKDPDSCLRFTIHQIEKWRMR